MTRREKNCPSQTRLPEAAHRAATFSVLAAKVTWATEAKRGGAEGREGATDYGAVPDATPVFSCPRATRRTEAAHRAATFSVLADEVTFATEAKRRAAEGREGATDYGAVPDDAPVFRMQARGAARSWSAAFTSAGDVPIQQARGAARLRSAASTSAGVVAAVHAFGVLAVAGGGSCASAGDFAAGVRAGLGGSPARRAGRRRR